MIKEFTKSGIVQYNIPLLDEGEVVDNVTTGHLSYNRFYRTLGKEKIENLKLEVDKMNIQTNAEQIIWINPKYIGQAIYKDVYYFDINSSFPNGIMMLPNSMIDLQDYTMDLYEEKKLAKNELEKLQKKNLLNMLVGYFNKINAFRPLRHQIILNSNDYVWSYKNTIERNGGTVYLINVDGLITDSIGADVMSKYLGSGLGEFKLSIKSDRLIYFSNVVYQIGNMIKYSGKGKLEKANIDLFEGTDAEQLNKFINGKDYNLFTSDKELSRLCVYYTKDVNVIVRNILGEIIKDKIYTIGGK